MEAYSLVDNNTRRKMEEMLQTWKQPVPGSIDTRPVFPAEIVRPIESALLKAKTSMFRAEQEHMRSQQQLLGGRGRSPQLRPDIPWRETPTPPGVHQMPNVGGYGQQQAYPPTAGGPPPQAIASYPVSFPASLNGLARQLTRLGSHSPDHHGQHHSPHCRLIQCQCNKARHGIHHNQQRRLR